MPLTQLPNGARQRVRSYLRPLALESLEERLVLAGPDLVLEDMIIDRLQAKVGDVVEVSWTVINRGDVSASGAWLDQIWLSTDDRRDDADVPLGAVAAPVDRIPLQENESYEQKAVSVRIPIDFDLKEGAYYIIVEADASHNLGDVDTSNNISSQQIQLMPTTFLPPWRYEMPDGATGSCSYRDETYSGMKEEGWWLQGGVGQLTDGVVGSDNWQENLGNGCAYEWIAWGPTSPSPDITFDFGQIAPLVSVGIHTTTFSSNASVFRSVTLRLSNDPEFLDAPQTIIYEPTPEERQLGSRFITVPIEHEARYVRATFTRGELPWIAISEVVFASGVEKVDFADLQLEDVVLNPAQIQIGEPLDVSWIVRNAGPGAATGIWRDRVWLSRDDTLDPTDALLATVTAPRERIPLPVGEEYEQSQIRVKSPVDFGFLEGVYYIIVEIDVDDDLAEANEVNRYVAQPVEITPTMSLKPWRYDMPDGSTGSCSYRDETYSGMKEEGWWLQGGVGQLTDGVVGSDNWQENLGNGCAYEWVAWGPRSPSLEITFDFGQIAPLVSANFHTTTFGSNASVFRGVTLRLSNDPEFLDAPETVVYEPTPEERRLGSRFITVPIEHEARYVRATFTRGELPWIAISEVIFASEVEEVDFADLQLEDVVPNPTQIQIGDLLDVSWTVRNAGPGAATGIWRDRVWLSRDDTLDPTDTLLATVTAPRERILLPAGDEYEQSQIRVKSPVDFGYLAGVYYVIVEIDVDDDLAEAGEANRYVAEAVQIAPMTLVEPRRYEMPDGTRGAFSYEDRTYSGTKEDGWLSGGVGQLTDGVVGSDNWQENLGNGRAYEWVAWGPTNPTPEITLDFGQAIALMNVGFHTNTSPSDTSVFGSATVELSNDPNFGSVAATIVRETTQDERRLGSRFIAVPLGHEARYVRVTFTRGDKPWIAISELVFTSLAPEFDPVPPRVNHQSPAGDVTGSVDHVDMWFTETIYHATFTESDVTIRHEDGDVIPVGTISEVGLNRFRIGFDKLEKEGLYQIDVGPDVTDLAGNRLNQDGDSIFGEEEDAYHGALNFVPVDLEIDAVTVTQATQTVGEELSVSWEGRNDSGAALVGTWTDAVYLSRDETWDIDDILVGKSEHSDGLAKDTPYTGELSTYVPGVLPGEYFVLVRADAHNDEKEASGETQDNTQHSEPITVAMRELSSDGALVRGELSGRDPYDYFSISVEPNESVRLHLDSHGTTASNELYVSGENIPTRVDFDARSHGESPDQELVFTGGVNGGTYYVLVYGNVAVASVAYDVSAQTGPIFLSTISPGRHGNADLATITVNGAGFTPDSTAEFVDSDEHSYAPMNVEYVSPLTLVLTLDLSSWPDDTYDVRVTRDPAEATPVYAELRDAFEASHGGVARLETNMVLPERVGLHIPIRQTIWIEYENTGTLPMPAPLLKLHGDNAAQITADPDLAKPVSGFAEVPGVTDTVQVLGLGSSATPWILQPGEKGRIPIYYIGVSQSAFVPQITFTLTTVKSDDTRSIDWDEQAEVMRPSGIDDATWADQLPNLQEWFGPTWGHYVSRLNEAVRYWGELSARPITNVDELFVLSTYSLVCSHAQVNDEARRQSTHQYQPRSGIPYAINSPFGWRRHNLNWIHDGIDITYPILTELFPIVGGNGWDAHYQGVQGDYGYQVYAANDEIGLAYAYSHLEPATFDVLYADSQVLPDVQSNQVIALSGDTGRRTGPHVHIRITEMNGQTRSRKVNPLAAFSEFWPRLYPTTPPNRPEPGPMGHGRLQGNDVVMTLAVGAPTMDLDTTEIALIGVNGEGWLGPRRSWNLSVTAPPHSRLIFEGDNTPGYSNMWSINTRLEDLPTHDDYRDGDAIESWTFMVTARTVRGATSSSTFCYATVNGDCTGTDYAGVIVTPTQGLLTTEDGASATFQVVLNSRPTIDVTIPIRTSDDTEGQLSISNLTFGHWNWDVPQEVTITGSDDEERDGHVNYTVILEPVASQDPNYDGIDPNDVSVVNRDNDGGGPGFTVSYGSGTGGSGGTLITTEDGGQDWFSVTPNTQPTANVVIPVESSDLTEGVTSVSELTFTPDNWRNAQVVTVTGVDDDELDGDVAYSIRLLPAISDDSDYGGRDVPNVSAINRDNEQSPPPNPPDPPGPGKHGTTTTVGSFDPNDKLGPLGYGESGYVRADEALAYQIRFENKEDATAPAREIVVSDVLDEDLDLSTFELTEIAFGGTTIFVPPGLDHFQTTVPFDADGTQILVDVSVDLILSDRELRLALRAVDPNTGWFPEDPLVGLLYPNKNPPEGDGHISYVVKPKEGLPSGTLIENGASIIFDYNAPIDTPLVRNSLDAGAPVSSVLQLPATTEETTFTLRWSGRDEPGGSDIRAYDIYVAVDDGHYVPLLDDTTETSTTFEAEQGHTYHFYSVATDNVGHVQAGPYEHVTTRVPGEIPPPVVTIDTIKTNDRTPALSGTVDDPTAVIVVTINGTQYDAQNDAQGRWLLPDNTITPELAAGVYDVQVSATSEAAITGVDSTTAELEIDLAGPSVEIVEVTPKYRGEAVEQITIRFSEPISGFDLPDLRLTRSTDTIVDLLPGDATLTSSDNVTWLLGNISSVTQSSGIYELTLSANGSDIFDEAGNPLTKDAIDTWINRPGDSTGDDLFDQFDLIRVLQAGKYQTGEPATWSGGDWSGNGVFDRFDIIIALQGGQYLRNSAAVFRPRVHGELDVLAKRGDNGELEDGGVLDALYGELDEKMANLPWP